MKKNRFRGLLLLGLILVVGMMAPATIWAESSISVSPESFTETLNRGQMVTRNLQLTNSGTTDLTYYIWHQSYIMTDSLEPGGPVYTWQDISTTGVNMGISSSDDSYEMVSLYFPFTFYGNVYHEIYVSTNGHITFGYGDDGYYPNADLSYDTSGNFLGGFGEDLNPGYAGDIYYLNEANRTIIQYEGVEGYSPDVGPNTFQIVLESTGKIYLYYKELTGNILDATIGIQNSNETDAYQITPNSTYPYNGLAIEFAPSWVSVDSALESGTVPAETSIDIPVTIDPQRVSLGLNTYNLEIDHNATNTASPLLVPISITVNNLPPTAAFEVSPTTIESQDQITLDASTSTDDGTIVSYDWDLDNDGQYDDGTGQVITHSFATNGTHTVGLQVTDQDDVTDTIAQEIVVLNKAPEGQISYAPTRIEANQLVTFDASASVDFDGSIVSYAWDLDQDGSYDDGTGVTASRDFTGIGSYVIGLQLTDNQNAVSTTSITVEVRNDWAKMQVMPTELNPILTTNQVGSETLTITNIGGQDLNYTLQPIFDLSKIQAGGPDQFGYYWTDSDQPGGPRYQWNDIQTIGQLSRVGNGYSSEKITFSFDFSFYGNVYRDIFINEIGILTFGNSSYQWNNTSLPNLNSPGNLIAPFHDDLELDGDIYYYDSGSELIIQYNDLDYFGLSEGNLTFQVVLAADGSITFYYKTLDGILNSATVGIQNSTQDDGLEIVYNEDTYLKENFAVRIETKPSWFDLTPISGTIFPGEQADITLDFDTTGLWSDTFMGGVEISHNASNLVDPISIPITLTVDNLAPVVDVVYDFTYLNYPTFFDATGSYDPDGPTSALSYAWEVTGDDLYDDGVDPTLTYAFLTPGIHTVGLQITDEDGATTTHTFEVDVTNPPLISVTPASFDQSLYRGETGVGTVSITNNGQADLLFNLEPIYLTEDTYYGVDSDSIGGPAYVWNDITTDGLRLETISTSNTGSELVTLGFDFPFYGENYRQVYVNTHGYLTLGVASTDDYASSTLPSRNEPKNLIAGYFTDIMPSYGGDIYYKLTEQRLVVQYNQVDNYDNSPYTFQIVLDADGTITYYYQTMGIVQESGLVGIQNYSQDQGVKIAATSGYVKDQFAVQISNRPQGIELGLSSGVVLPGQTAEVPVTFSTNGYASGLYNPQITVVHNAPNESIPLLVPVNLTILNHLPTAEITYQPTAPITGEVVTLTGSGTDSDGTIEAYAWDLDQDGFYDDAIGPTISHTYTTPGDHTVGLQVTDSDGGIATTTLVVTLQNQPPVANVTFAPERPDPGQAITFDATASTDVDGTVISYAWDLDNDGVYDDGATATATTSFTQAGTYTIGVEVTDDFGGTGIATTTVTVDSWPKLTVTPGTFTETLSVDQVVTRSFTITNTGGLDLQYNLTPTQDWTGYNGPDQFGYYWIDSDAVNGPTFTWQDISTIGTQLTNFSSGSYGFQGLDLSFDFPFYGELYQQVFITTYGYLTVGGTGVNDGYNGSIPGYSNPANMIAAAFDSISLGSGSIYYYDTGNKLIVQYDGVTDYMGSGSLTFQIVLDQQGDITFYYHTLTGSTSYSTVGIQNATRDDGLSVAYYQSYLKDQLAVRITTLPNWIATTHQPVLISAGQSVPVVFTIDPTALKSSDYLGELEITHNGNNTTNPLTVPINLTVSNTGPTPSITHNPAYVNYPVYFDAMGSVDVDGTIVGYAWDLNNDGVYDDGSEPMVSKSWDAPGTYTISLELTDDDATTTIETITVEVLIPPQIAVTPANLAAHLARTNTFTGDLTITNAGGSPLEYQIVRAGLDAYYWADSDQIDGPVYNWTDISTTGTLLSDISDVYSGSTLVDLNFDFPFYGNEYHQMYVNAEGYITFGASASDSSNTALPGTGSPANMIAPFFDNLSPLNGGNIYYQSDANQAIIQWDQIYGLSSRTYTFQAVLHADGTIYFYYKSVIGIANTGTVGVQNSTRDQGTTIAYDEEYIKDGLAVRLTNQPLWLSLTESTGTLTAGGGSTVIPVTIQTAGFPATTQSANIEIYHNVPGTPNPFIVPCTLDVINIAPTATITATPTDVYVGDVVTFDATGSTDADGSIQSYLWDLNNDGVYDDATGSVVSHNFATNGDQTVGLQVTDNDGAISTTTMMITVLNTLPVAEFTFTPSKPEPGQVITFDATISTDFDGIITGYAWDLDGDGQYDDGTGASISHSFATINSYTIGLEVTDDDGGTATITKTLQVENWPKVALNLTNINETTTTGQVLNQALTITNTGGLDLTYSLVPEYTPSNISGGPDQFGYFWADSDDLDGPVYVWEDISTKGTLLNQISTGSDYNEQVQLSFDFPFYGTAYRKMYVSRYGYLTFGTVSYDSYNSKSLPNTSDPSAMIAGFFDYLYPDTNGDIYFYDSGEKAIIQFEQVANSGSGNVTFQIVLEQDGTITFYYKTLTGTLTSATVGMQNTTRDDGLTVVYNSTYLKDQLAVRIERMDWLSMSSVTGTILPTETATIDLTIDTTGLNSKVYTGQLALSHNGINQSDPLLIPLEVTVENLAPVANIQSGDLYTNYPILLDATKSTDADGTIVSYEWELTGDSLYDDATGPTLEQLYALPGQVQIGLRLTDDDGATTIENITLDVVDPPQLSVTQPSLAASLPANQVATETLILSNLGVTDLNFTMEKAYLNGQYLYQWRDSDQPGGPAFVWNDISTIGEELTDLYNSAARYEDRYSSFDFPLYDKVSNHLVIFNEGYVALDNYYVSSTNSGVLPQQYDPPSLIAGFYDNLDWTNGKIYYYDDGEQVTIQYENGDRYTHDSLYKFQIVLQADGTITYYYHTMSGVLNSATIGIQNETKDQGLTVVCDQEYVKDSFAVQISRQPLWVMTGQNAGTIGADGTLAIPVTFNGYNMVRGTYAGNLEIYHNDPAQTNPLLIPVTLTVTNTLPTGVITYSPTYFYSADTITFDGTGSTDPDGTIASYAWDLDNDGLYDDGYTAIIDHSFALPGEYTVGLKVTDNDGGIATISTTVTVHNRTPEAVITMNPTSVWTGDEVTFDASSSTDADGTIVAYAWDVDGDGFDDGTGPTLTHTFTENGYQTVQVQVTDNLGATRTTFVHFAVSNRLPVASFSYTPPAPMTGEEIAFDATNSTDADGTIVSYAWDFDDDGFYDDATGSLATWTFTTSGNHRVKVKVIDDDNGPDTETVTITVQNQLPTAQITHSEVVRGQVVTFDGTGSTDPDGTITNYAWDFDHDGNYDNGTGSIATTTFTEYGTYLIGLQVTDDANGTATTSVSVTVTNVEPTAQIIYDPTQLVIDRLITLDGTSSVDPDGSIVSYAWDLDADGVYDNGTDGIVTTSYSTPGTYTVGLEVTDDQGVAVTTTITLTVNDLSHIAITPGSFTETMNMGEVLTKTLTIANTGEANLNFDITLGSTPATVVGGPDAFDYVWTDSKSQDGPTYVWNDISSTGTLLSQVSSADDGYQLVDLSFIFPFYGEGFNRMYVGSNGYITFGQGTGQYNHYLMPSSSMPDFLIAAFMTDLNPGADGDIYYQDQGDHVIVQFENVANYGNTAQYTFQIVLYNDGKVMLYYNTLNGSATFASVGTQKDATLGLNVVYNSQYLANGLAVQINQQPSWLQVEPATGTVLPGQTADLTLTMDGTTLLAGLYHEELQISHNGVETNPQVIPVDLTVNTAYPPFAQITYSPSTVYRNEEVTFDASDSFDADGTIVRYEWDLDNDGLYDDGTGVTATKTWSDRGSYPIGLRIVDDQGHTRTAWINVIVNNHTPVITLTYTPNNPQVGDEIVFDTTGTYDPDGTVVNYEWDLDYDSYYDDGTGATISHTFDANGSYYVRVRAWDNDGSYSSRSIRVVIGNEAPQANFTYTPNDPLVGMSVNFNASDSYDPDGWIHSYAWDLDNDGLFDDSSSSGVQTTFATPGIHQVSLQITDNNGATDVVTMPVTVYELAVENLQVRPDFNSVNLTWTTPSSVEGVIVLRKTDGYPTSATDGEIVYESSSIMNIFSAVVDENLPDGTYYYAVFANANGSYGTIAETGMATVPEGTAKVVERFQLGNANPHSVVYMAKSWERDLHVEWNRERHQLGRGVSGRDSNLWIQFPELVGSLRGQIPANAEIERAKLVFKVENISYPLGKAYHLNLYEITDPDGLGTPAVATQDGYRKGLDFFYRDHRPGMDIPWSQTGANILDLLAGTTPVATTELKVKEAEPQEIQFDLTDSVQGMVNGRANMGWLMTLDGEWAPGQRILIDGLGTSEQSLRPYLEVVYTTAGLTQAPDPVSSVSAVPGYRQVTLNWTEPTTYFTGVKILRKFGSLPLDPYDGQLVFDGSGTSHTDTGINDGNGYYYSIFTYDDQRTYSTPYSIRVESGTPASPTLDQPLGDAGSVTLTYQGNDLVSKFHIWRQKVGVDQPVLLAEVTGTEYTDWNVDTQAYTYWVTAVNYNGDSQPSEKYTITPQPATLLPTVINTLTATADSENSTQIELTWTDETNRATEYLIERRILGGTWNVIARVPFNQSSYLDIGLEPSTTYEYQVAAVNTAGSSDYLATTATTTGIPVAPTDLSWTLVSGSQIRLSWTDSVNEDYYTVEVMYLGDSYIETTIYGTYNAGTTSCTITGLRSDSLYKIRLIAENATGRVLVSTEEIPTVNQPKRDLF